MRHSILAGLLLLLAAGCGVDTTNCPDCGGCGIAGPVENPGKDINVLGPGVDAGGGAAVDLGLEDGVCNSEARKAFRVSYDAGAVTVSPAEGLAKLDETKTTFQGETYTWTDRDLAVSFARSGTTVLLTFTETAKTTKVACDGANHAITCAPM